MAPIGGVVIFRHVDPGETVTPGSPLVTIVDLSRLRVEAEVDEFDIAGIALGGARRRSWPRDIPGALDGQVEEIPYAVVSRQTRPDDPGRPADTRVLRVKVAFREPNPLKLGQHVEVEIAKGGEETLTSQPISIRPKTRRPSSRPLRTCHTVVERLIFCRVDDGIRTRDTQIHNLVP